VGCVQKLGERLTQAFQLCVLRWVQLTVGTSLLLNLPLELCIAQKALAMGSEPSRVQFQRVHHSEHVATICIPLGLAQMGQITLGTFRASRHFMILHGAGGAACRMIEY
jgi:hypothetical protein